VEEYFQQWQQLNWNTANVYYFKVPYEFPYRKIDGGRVTEFETYKPITPTERKLLDMFTLDQFLCLAQAKMALFPSERMGKIEDQILWEIV
jgi:hypothetical protein